MHPVFADKKAYLLEDYSWGKNAYATARLLVSIGLMPMCYAQRIGLQVSQRLRRRPDNSVSKVGNWLTDILRSHRRQVRGKNKRQSPAALAMLLLAIL